MDKYDLKTNPGLALRPSTHQHRVLSAARWQQTGTAHDCNKHSTMERNASGGERLRHGGNLVLATPDVLLRLALCEGAHLL